jgi:hypothetical protein
MSGDLNESLPLQDLESIWSGSEEDLAPVQHTPQRVLPICSRLRIFGITRARLSPALPDADAFAYHYT